GSLTLAHGKASAAVSTARARVTTRIMATSATEGNIYPPRRGGTGQGVACLRESGRATGLATACLPTIWGTGIGRRAGVVTAARHGVRAQRPEPLPPGGPMPTPRTSPRRLSRPRLAAVADQAPRTDSFRADVLRGLGRARKELPCKYFYDQRGSQL